MSTEEALASLELLKYYMKEYVELKVSFALNQNEESLFMKGSVAYQEIMLAQTLAKYNRAVFVENDEFLFQDEERCTASFFSWKEALIGEMDYQKRRADERNRNRHRRGEEGGNSLHLEG